MSWIRSPGLMVILSVAGGILSGCMIGPAAVQVSRVRYNEVIQKTTDEQLLLNLVRLQYRDAPAFLEVGSVSAQFVFTESADLTGTLNEGPNPVNANRLAIGVGVGYQERPTITFTPLQGKEFVTALLSPLHPDVIVLLSQSGWSIDRILRLTVQGMNGLDNASSASGPTPARQPRYERFARASRLFRALQEKGLLELGYESRPTVLSAPIPADRITLPDVVDAVGQGLGIRHTEDGQGVVVTGSFRALVWRIPPHAVSSPEVGEIVELLALTPGQRSYEIRAGAGALSDSTAGPGERRQIGVSMRSLMGTLFYLSQVVEVPAEHRKKGLVTTTSDAAGQPFDWTLVTGNLLRVRSQRGRPSDTAVTVRHRGRWFYIDDTDLDSKSTFALLGQLFALQAGGVESVAPVLTLPVGG